MYISKPERYCTADGTQCCRMGRRDGGAGEPHHAAHAGPPLGRRVALVEGDVHRVAAPALLQHQRPAGPLLGREGGDVAQPRGGLGRGPGLGLERRRRGGGGGEGEEEGEGEGAHGACALSQIGPAVRHRIPTVRARRV